MRLASADDPEMVQDAKMATVVEGQLTGKTTEEFNNLTVVECLKSPK